MAESATTSPESSFAPQRQRVDIRVGSFVRVEGDIYRITQVLDFASVVGTHVETGRSVPLLIIDLSPLDPAGSLPPATDLAELADVDWKIAQQRYEALKPLLGTGGIVGRRDVEARAKEVGVNAATLYRWLNRYQSYGVMSALIPKVRGCRQGKRRIGNRQEEVIQEVIDDFYLTKQRPTKEKAVEEVLRRCQLRVIEPAPSPGTIRARLFEVSERRTLRGRGYAEKAKNKFMPAAGSFPNADFPLAVVQIDHTPADIIVVDDRYRQPIGRLWITLAIDVFSRMVVGYYLSFDAPSETSVAMCVAHAVMPKDDWLLLHDVDASWPVWGLPKTIHVDNGADFRSENFRQSCLMYGIHLEFRPVKQPRYGGHIERMLGTLAREIHSLPGTTFSSIKERDEYDSDKHAALTKNEFENWLVTYICKVYHQRLHSSIGMTPARKWEIGIFGNSVQPGVGLPERPGDRMTLLLDFMPSFRRTVQTFGVSIDGLTYYAESLRPWINAQDPDNPSAKRDFIFRRDPRDITMIWFFDPTIKQYFKIPLADQSLPPMSLWEYLDVRRQLRSEGKKSVNQRQVLTAVTELRGKVDQAKEKTRRARRQSQRRKEHEKNITPAVPIAPDKPSDVLTPPPPSPPLDDDVVYPVEAFDDIE
jgi:putative transposase